MRRSMLLLIAAIVPAGCDRRSPAAEQGNAAAANLAAASPDEAAPAAVPPAGPSMGKVDRSHAGAAAPAFAFRDPAGKEVSLAAFRGRPVLVNLWATWCGPCVRELPTLDALAAREAGRIAVVALNQDGDGGKAAPFLAARKLTLKPYTDPAMHWLPAVTATLPTTILYGADGRERWRVTGDLDWTGAAAKEALAGA